MTNFDTKTYNIFVGTYNCSDWQLVAAYDSKACFIKKLRELGYEKDWGKITKEDNVFQKHFGKYSISIL